MKKILIKQEKFFDNFLTGKLCLPGEDNYILIYKYLLHFAQKTLIQQQHFER